MASILIVDDAPENILVLGKVLMGRYDVHVATSGEEGVEVASAQQPDLILLDLYMPGMDGLAVMQRLRASATTRDIPVMLVTAEVSATVRQTALAAGAVDVLEKPVDIPQLLGRLARLLAP